MKFVPPQAITDATLLSTNVAEDDYAAWAAPTSYDKGDRCRVNAVHKVYQSLIDDNVGNDPTTTSVAVGDVPAKWIEVGATNPWRMFEKSVQSQATALGMIEVVIAVDGIIDNLFLFNSDGSALEIVMEDADEGIVVSETFSLVNDAGSDNWYDFFFKTPRRRRDIAIEGLPPYANPTLTVRLLAPDETVRCGALIIGQEVELGFTQWGMQFGIRDYSTKAENDFGDIQVVERPYSRWGNFNLWVPPDLTDEVVEQLAQYRATPVVWVGDGRYAASVTYGYFDDLTVEVPYEDMSAASLRTKGLT